MAITTILSNADYFLLIFFRVAALVVTSPVFGRVMIPNLAKIALIASTSFLFFFAIPPTYTIVYDSLIGFLLLVFLEVLVGIILAFVTNLFFAAAFIGGHYIDMQIGFGIVNVFDIQNNTQVPMIGNFLNMVMLVVFFIVNGHLRLIEIIYITIEKLPVGNLSLSPNIGLTALNIFTNAFMLGIMIALPVIASGLILEICFGALMKTVPQLHMFVVGVPLKLYLGFFILMTMLPIYVNFTDRIFSEMFSSIDKMFAALLSP